MSLDNTRIFILTSLDNVYLFLSLSSLDPPADIKDRLLGGGVIIYPESIQIVF